ncbi:hypothetical protein [Micromonospora tulbaghiae]|nr:hypothetical protein [Micromonospora tulbaghiae]
MAGLYPGSSAVRVFFGPGEGLPGSAWTDATRVGRQRLADLPAGCTVVVSFKDQHVNRLAFVEAWREARPDVDLILITHHEPEQQEGGDPTPAQYRASWTRTREQVGDHPARAEGRLRLAVCWTLQWIRRGGDWRTWWPDHEADAVDLVLGDWYPYTPGAPDPYRPTSYEEPAAALKVMVDLAAATGKDWGLAEVDHRRILRANGYAADVDPTGELCATWYRQMHTTAKELGCRVWAHFHRDMGAALGDLTKRPAEQAALRQLITQEANDVGRQRRLNWVKDGSPFRLMTPARDLRDILRGHGYTVYDIGNRSHLEADPPEDHTPYSATGFPGKARYGVGYALDVMPPAAGARSKVDGLPLPSLQRIGAQLLADRKAGVGGIRWLKYMNWEPERNNGGPCWHESWEPTYARRSSTDRGHIHLSGLTGYETSTIAAGYDPVARIRGDDDDMMTPKQFLALLQDPAVDFHLRGTAWRYVGGGIPAGMSTLGVLNETLIRLRALGEIVAAESSSPDEVRALLADLELPAPEPVDVDAFAAQVAQRVLAGLPAGDGPVRQEDLVAAIRTVLASLAAPAPQS